MQQWLRLSGDKAAAENERRLVDLSLDESNIFSAGSRRLLPVVLSGGARLANRFRTCIGKGRLKQCCMSEVCVFLKQCNG